MTAVKFNSRWSIVIVAIAVVLVAAAISIPIYISSLERERSPDNNKPEAYTSDASLQFQDGEFRFQGNNFRILSGAVHYFRSFPETWNNTLRKLKACGFNTVETWLLNDPNMKVRSNYQGYKDAVERYFNKLLPMVADLQISLGSVVENMDCIEKILSKSNYSKGGPIIAIQVENEFGSYGSEVEHLKFIRDLYIKHGLKEMFITSDNNWGQKEAEFYQYALPTANFKEISEGKELFDQIRKWGPEFPLMVTEFWTGWFDHWTSKHNPTSLEAYTASLEFILQANASMNMYMFHGGTNFGFLNGANNFDTYKPDVSSYDYDALLTEAGDITPKYLKTRKLFLDHVLKQQGITTLPNIPEESKKQAYGSVKAEATVPWTTLLASSKVIAANAPVAMEMLKLHKGYGQNFGYILYQCSIPGNASAVTMANQPADRAQVFVDDTEIAVIDWHSTPESLTITLPAASNTQASRQLGILVENHGRVNYGTAESGILNIQRKGLTGSVTCDGKQIESFKIIPLEFKSDAVNRSDWVTDMKAATVPGLFKAKLQVTGEPADTFVFMKGWGKGILFVNGFNLGRYWSAGPQQTLYLPAQVLKQGANELVAFEHGNIGQDIMFLNKPILDVNDQSTIQP